MYLLRKIWYYMRIMDYQRFQQRFQRRLDNHFHVALLFDYLPEVIFYSKNTRSQFVKVNEAFLKNVGVKHEEQVVGKTDLDFFPRDLAEQYIAEDRRVMRGLVPIPNQVWLVPDGEGRLKWYLSSKTPLFGDGGKVIGIAGAMRDYERAGAVLEPYREMEAVVAHVLTHYADPLAVPQLARLVHLSLSQFDRKFKRLFQMSPQQFILRVRVNAACQDLTRTDLSITQIAQRAGFYDQSYFTKQFRKLMGHTPTGYRRKYHRGGEGIAVRDEG